MKKKNIFLKYFNIRFFRHLLFLAIVRIPYIRKLFNLVPFYKYVEEISCTLIKENSEIINLNLTEQEKEFFKLPRKIKISNRIYLINNIEFNGYSGVSVFDSLYVISDCNNTGSLVHRNQFRAKILKTKEADDNVLYLNCLGFRKGHKQIYHFYQDLVSLIAILYYNSHEIAKFTKLKEIRIIVRDDLSSVQKLILESLPKEFGKFIVKIEQLKSNYKIFCKNIIHVSLDSDYNRRFMTIDTINFVNKILQEKIHNFNLSEINKNIFISRSDAKIRKLKNEKEIVTKLKDYKVIQASKLPALEQIKYFAEAEKIIAPHGAGLTNLIYCDKGLELVELFPANYNDAAYIVICKLMDIKYQFKLGSNGDMHQNFRLEEIYS